MTAAELEKKNDTNWKKHLLRSGVPLEYQVARMLSSAGMHVEADFSYVRHDGNIPKEFSIDIVASRYENRPKEGKLALCLAIECKYRSQEKSILFMPEPNAEPIVTLGGTVSKFDFLVPYFFPLNAYVSLESKYDFVYKGIEISAQGAVEQEIRHGIQQLRYATPAVLRRDFDFQIFGHPSDCVAIVFAKILVTNAPIKIMNEGCDISAIEQAKSLDDITSPQDTVILFSDYGPDYEDHFRRVFQGEKDRRLDALVKRRTALERAGKKIDSFTDPVRIFSDLSDASRFECRSVSTQFFITNLEGLNALVEDIMESSQAAYKDRKKSQK